MNLITRFVILAISIFVASYILPGVKISSPTALFVVAVLLGIINVSIKPLLIILTLPLTIITLGLFLLILNGLLILGLSNIVPGFEVAGLFTAIIFSVVVSLISSILNHLL